MQRSRHDQEHEDLGKARGHVRVGVSCATVAAYAGTGNCNVRWDASTTCHDTYAPQSGEYVLTVECWGVHGRPKQVPLYEVGPCERSSRWSPLDRPCREQPQDQLAHFVVERRRRHRHARGDLSGLTLRGGAEQPRGDQRTRIDDAPGVLAHVARASLGSRCVTSGFGSAFGGIGDLCQ